MDQIFIYFQMPTVSSAVSLWILHFYSNITTETNVYKLFNHTIKS